MPRINAVSCMQDINLKCEPGTLTMVVGAVGSGKSSLLATLFQQISRLRGTIKVRCYSAPVLRSQSRCNQSVGCICAQCLRCPQNCSGS